MRLVRAGRLAVLGAVVLAAGMLPGSGAAAGGDDVVETEYRCRFPGGAEQVPVAVRARLPESGRPGEPIEPTGVGVQVRLPVGELRDALPEGTERVAGSAELRVDVRQGEDAAEAAWGALAARETPLPEDAGAELELDHRGEVPTVTVGAAGEVAFEAGDLTLDLVPDGAEAERLRVSCASASSTPVWLGRVEVREPSGGDTGEGSESPGESPSATSREHDKAAGERDIAVGPEAAAEPSTGPCADEPLDLGADDLAPEAIARTPPDATINTRAGTLGCAYAVGFSNVRKLGGAMIVNDPRREPAPLYVMMNVRDARYAGDESYPKWSELDHVGELELPDARSTFLTFDFVPVSARVSFETGVFTLTSIEEDGAHMVMTLTFPLAIRLHDVRINGTPVDVGAKCRTPRFQAELTGVDPEYNLLQGGPLRGHLDLPSFRGCGTAQGENLNRLFTTTLSGPDNYLQLQQGPVCGAAGGECGAEIPELPELRKQLGDDTRGAGE